ncbi:hypothetical protein ACWCQQ_45550 [Streptomyces sp. NPDC002143]
MLDEASVALATSVGSAVAQAAGTDAWLAFRNRLARLLGCGDRQQETAQRERLDRTADDLAEAGQGGDGPEGTGDEERNRCGTAWRTRTEDLLEQLEPDERAAVTAELRALLDEVAEGAPPAAGGVARNVFLGSTAVQYGDGNVQVNRFDSRP